ncbi:cytochrome P450 2B1-like [Clavelina lepadiformis]|uniref:cytochrome P450 2B1-like n=1 Tax=Clavelina lepadiformis TaxID=159417 RepID=UPI0040420D15
MHVQCDMFSDLFSTVCWIFCSALNVWTILALLAVSFYQWWKKPHPNFPPGPRGLPIIGVLPWLGGDPQKVLFDWGQKYGPVMSVRMAGVDTVFLNTYDAINTAFVKQGDIFSGRAALRLVRDILGNNGLVLTDYGDKQLSQKRFAMKTLRKLGMGKPEMENIINEEMCHFANYLETKVGKPIDLALGYDNMTGNVICVTAFGRRFDYDDPQLKHIFQLLQNQYVADESLLILLFHFHDYIHFIPPFKAVKERFTKTEHAILDAMQTIIDEHKKNFQPDCIRDYIDAFLYEQKYGQEKKYFTETQLRVTCRDLFEAGTETTSTTLAWLFLGLLNYPEYHKQIVAEVDQILGSSSNPTMAHRSSMPVTCAFIQELMRYCPIVPNSVGHKTTKDTELYGFTLPKGTNVMPNIYAAHFDPNTWPNPHEFNPGRHIDQDGKFLYSPKVIPFSLGSRACTGEHLARMEVFLVFIGILKKFTIKPGSSDLPSMMEGHLGIVYGPKSYKIILGFR